MKAHTIAQYEAFAIRAISDTMPKIAAMFRAIATAEAIHLENTLAELEKLGSKFKPSVGKITVESTINNLYKAKNGEEYQVQSMYPDMIATAETEKARSVQKMFDRTMATEAKHAQLFISAIEALSVGSDIMGSSWVICPECGDTYISGTEPERCEVCNTKAKKFQLL